jgi:hypothetical protein
LLTPESRGIGLLLVQVLSRAAFLDVVILPIGGVVDSYTHPHIRVRDRRLIQGERQLVVAVAATGGQRYAKYEKTKKPFHLITLHRF